LVNKLAGLVCVYETLMDMNFGPLRRQPVLITIDGTPATLRNKRGQLKANPTRTDDIGRLKDVWVQPGRYMLTLALTGSSVPLIIAPTWCE
jgi:hypothetical protein